MSMDSILFSRFFLTFSSCPEYAWTTYHCASCSGAVALFSTATLLDSVVDQALGGLTQEVVGTPDEHAEHDHGEDDDQRVAVQLAGRRPDDLAELLVDLTQESSRSEFRGWPVCTLVGCKG